MNIYDISLPISSALPVWPGDPPVDIVQALSADEDNPFTVSRIHMGTHTGTHVDAPRHIFKEGRTVETLDLHILIGPAYVVDARGIPRLTAPALETLSVPSGVERLLFLTDNASLWEKHPTTFHTDFVAFSADGAEWLVERGIKLVGIDYLSIALYGQEVAPHQILLGSGAIIVEGLLLTHVPPGFYELVCLPLKIVGADGAPARAVLISR